MPEQQQQAGIVRQSRHGDMELYTYVIRFDGNHIVYQALGCSPTAAMLESLRCAKACPFRELLTTDQAEDMLVYLLSEEFGPKFAVQVDGCVNIWNESWVLSNDNASVFVTCVKTDV